MADRFSEETAEISGLRTLVRRSVGEGVPTLYVHGNPTHSREWLPFMERTRGPGLALDLPGFGRSEPLDGTGLVGDMHAHAAFLGAAMDELVPGEFNLLVHDWGAIALHPAQRRASRVRRLVVIDAVPLLPGYRWHWIARIWRRRPLGELFNAINTRAGIALLLRQARPGLRAMPDDFVSMIWEAWDRRTSRAILELYRSADPELLEAAGAHLQRLDCPSLVVWGRRDPFLGVELARRYAARLPAAELLELDDAGHWPWIDQPELVGRVADFLAA